MGVGDYIHSKEAGQIHSATNDAANPHQSRRSIAEQARVGVPATKLVAPVPLPVNGKLNHGYHDNIQGNPAQGDMFDTDVEGADESTIAGTSVPDFDEPPPSYPSGQLQQSRNGAESRPLYQLQQARRGHESTWYENLGDRAMKTAGFGSDDIDTDGSQLPSAAGDDGDEEQTPTDDWYSSNHQTRRSVEDQPLSKRLESFWAASRRPYTSSNRPANTGPAEQPNSSIMATSAAPGSKNPGQVVPNRKITLPRSMTATPRTRFSPPKPSLLEQLESSPARHAAGLQTQPSRPKSTGLPFPPDEYDTESIGRPGSPQSVIALDEQHNMDPLDDHDDNDSIPEVFSKRFPTRPTPPPSRPANQKKRQLEADYPPEVLYQKPFGDLQAEPFDYTPPTTAPPPQTTNTTAPIVSTTPEAQGPTTDRISYLFRLSEEERAAYFANLPMREWEDCGDQLVDHFTTMLVKMKELRHARRKTASLFETEIKRRHDRAELQDAELSTKLHEMKEGGLGVLRGRTP